MNFFDLGGVGYIVDLPGYGYAKASKRDMRAGTRPRSSICRGGPT